MNKTVTAILALTIALTPVKVATALTATELVDATKTKLVSQGIPAEMFDNVHIKVYSGKYLPWTIAGYAKFGHARIEFAEWEDEEDEYFVYIAGPEVSRQNILIHEMGHVIQYKLLQTSKNGEVFARYFMATYGYTTDPGYYGLAKIPRGLDLSGQRKYFTSLFTKWREAQTVNG